MNRGRRLGLHSTAGRIRGGFQASMLPSGSTSANGNTCTGNGNQMIVIGPSGSVVEQRNECADSDIGDINVAVASILNFSKRSDE